MEQGDVPATMTTPAAAEPAPKKPAAEDLGHLVLDNLDTGLLALDPGGTVLFLNQVAADVLDVTLEDVRGRRLSDVVETDDADWLSPSGEDRVGDPSRMREVALRIGDKEVVVESSARVLEDRRGRSIGAVVTFRDISDTAEEEEFRRTAERLAHLGELSAVVAHEIRNPLTGIRTTIQFLETKLDPDHPLRGSVGDVISELDRIEKIITDLLVLARPPGGTRNLIDINSLLETSLDRVSRRLADTRVTLRKELAGDLPRVEVDEATTLQVFSNMLINAIDALADVDGDSETILRVSSALRRYRVKRPTVEVSFSDTGCGIPPEAKDRIFDPFFTMKSMGTGLGLPLSLQIMKDHGGTIHVRNRPQGGTIFKLQFPVPEGFEA